MLFKKEFDIDKDFFEDNEPQPRKRKIALKVFLVVTILTFFILCLSAFTLNLNFRFSPSVDNTMTATLKDAQEYYLDAIEEYENGNYDKAIEYLTIQLQIVDDPDAYCYLAKIYLEKEEVELAIENFRKALEFKKDFFEPNFELGKIYCSHNDYKTASKYLSQALLSQPDNSEVMALLAETYKKTGRADDAVSIFEKILEKEPENSFANAKIGEIYYQRMQYQTAIDYLEEAIKVSLDEAPALQLAKSYLELGELKQALSVVKDILSVFPDNSQALSLKKTIEYKLGLQKSNEKKPVIKNENIQEKPINKEVLDNYIKEIEESIKINWTPPVGSNLKKASVKFTINKDGELISNKIYATSGMASFDSSAIDAISLSNPFPPLPEALNRNTLDIIFTFDFNIKN